MKFSSWFSGIPGAGRGAGLAAMAVITPLLLVVPLSVQAESVWDKIKAAAEKNKQQQQQQQRQPQQRQTTAPAPAATRTAPAAAAAGAPVQIKSFDVRDVALGMSPAEAEKILRKHYPGYHVIPLQFKGYGQEWVGVLAAMPKTKHKDEVVLVDFAQPPQARKVIAVTRYKEFPANATPSLENVEKSLVEKYGNWSKGEATTRAGYRKIYGWWTGQSRSACIDERLSATFGRLREILQSDGLSRVLGDAYGNPSQYIKPFRNYVNLKPELAACGRQVAANLDYRPDRDFSPVGKMVTVVADFGTYYESEVAFTKMAKDYEYRKGASAVQQGGKPEL
jgi:hypothetical protein